MSFYKRGRERTVHVSPAFSAPTFDRRGTSAIVVHDLAFEDFPACYPLREKLYFALNMFFLRHSKSLVVVPSAYVLQQMQDRYGIAHGRLRQVSPYSGFEPTNTQKGASAPYFLMVSNNHPRKNLDNTIAGFLRSSAAAEGYKLLIVGNFEIDPQIDEDLVVVRSGVTDDELELLYSQCEALLLFSLSEGFGYPVAEAASLGRPSLTSEVTSLTEFVFNRHPEPAVAVEDIAARIDKFLQDEAYRHLVYEDIQMINDKYSRSVFEQNWRAVVRYIGQC